MNEQTIELNQKSAYAIIHYFFSLIDIIFFMIILYISKCYFYINMRLLSIMALDIIIRVIKILVYYSRQSFLKEFILTMICCFQFYLIISFINQAFISSGSYYANDVNQIGIGIIEFSFFILLFILLDFPFEKFYFNESNKFYLFKFLLLIICLYLFYKYIMNKFNNYLNNVSEKIQQNIFLFSILTSLPNLAFYSFFGKYVLQLFKLFLTNKLFIQYLEMAIITFNETAKNAIFIVLNGILYIFSLDLEFKRMSDKYDGVEISVNQGSN